MSSSLPEPPSSCPPTYISKIPLDAIVTLPSFASPRTLGESGKGAGTYSTSLTRSVSIRFFYMARTRLVMSRKRKIGERFIVTIHIR